MSGILSDALTEAIRQESKRTRQPTQNFRMSSMGHCPRKQVCLRAGLEPAFPPKDHAVIKIWVGTALHKATQAKLEACEFLDASWTEREVRYRSYVGHVDGLTRKLSGMEQYGPAVVEIKWTSDTSVTKYDWPAHYEWQNLGCVLAAGLKRGLLYQVGREYGLDREKVVVLTEEWRTRLEDEISWLEGLWDIYQANGTLPDCKHRFGWENKTCEYRQEEVKATPQSGWNPYAQTETDRELSDFLDKPSEEKKNGTTG